MNLRAPSILIFVIALALAVLAVVSIFYPTPFVSGYEFWFAIAAYLVLAIGTIG
jgi:hypothetical protein